jgi:hypothetical protein
MKKNIRSEEELLLISQVPQVYNNNNNASQKDKYIKFIDKMAMFYRREIETNLKFKSVITKYKHNEYAAINKLLYSNKVEIYDWSFPNFLKKIQSVNDAKITEVSSSSRTKPKTKTKPKTNTKPKTKTQNNEHDDVVSFVEGVNKKIKSMIDAKTHTLINQIASLDGVLSIAPFLGDDNIRVYRGMVYDIYDDIVCVDAVPYIVFPNFISSSFSPKRSFDFTQNQINPDGAGVMYTFLLKKNCRGLFLNFFDRGLSISFDNALIDSEYEYLISRGSKFRVVSVEMRRLPTRAKDVNNMLCPNIFPLIKHYTLEFVSNPSKSELEKSLSKIKANTKKKHNNDNHTFSYEYFLDN